MLKQNSLPGMAKLLVVLAGMLMISMYAFSQPNVSAQDIVDGFEKTMKDSGATGTLLKTMPVMSGADGWHGDSLRFAKELQMYDYNVHHLQRSFTWQFYSSIIIFIMVITIVVLGLVLSYKQFKLTEYQVKRNTTVNPDNKVALESSNATIEISQTGLKINTAVIGLAILFLSLLFFFLYLKYVYVIEVIQ